jgi:hypothetical protein
MVASPWSKRVEWLKHFRREFPSSTNRVDAQWISTKKDWREAKRRHKMQQALQGPNNNSSADAFPESNGTYNKEMDAMRCILYAHGGICYSLTQTIFFLMQIRRLLLWECRSRAVKIAVLVRLWT